MVLDELEAFVSQRFQQQPIEKPKFLQNLFVFQRNCKSDLETLVYNPVICLILRGRKEYVVGEHTISVCRGDSMLVSHELPVTSRIVEATEENPYLALVLELDMVLIRSLYEEVSDVLRDELEAKSMSAGTASETWIEPIYRYVRLHDNELEAKVLGPLILKEIHYQLLMSDIGGMLRNLITADSHASKIAKAIKTIRAHFREPMIVADLAQIAGMSTSSFHEHFKSVTGTTPLQYQKDLRLIEASNLLRTGNWSVASASYETGYESPTHFSRDYARKFGVSPKHHIGAQLSATTPQIALNG